MNKILIILSFVVIASCAPEVPDEDLVEWQGVTYEVNSQTPFTGTSVSYHDNGQLEVKVNYKEGEPDGLTEVYYDNGQLMVKANYKEGEPHGLAEVYYDDGQLRAKANYKHGERHGLKEIYYDNGELKEEAKYKDGERLWHRP